jgi:hypothetical protein
MRAENVFPAGSPPEGDTLLQKKFQIRQVECFTRRKEMKLHRFSQVALVMVMLVGLFALPLQSAQAFTIPTFSIVSVDKDVSVTIETANFPANQTFTVRMGAFGTLGIGGTVVGTTDSGSGGTFQATYDIPDGLKGSARIAIRMDSPEGFFSFNWFVNNTGTTPTPTPSPTTTPFSGIPTFSISSVVTDSTVTISTNNFPANRDFTVRMGAFGTAAVGGTVVATTSSGSGGSFSATYNIPDSLKGKTRIAIRMDSTTGGFFAFNWFWNRTSTATTPPPAFVGIPTFSITSVVHDSSVTITTNNFPANKDFTVRMGAFGTAAVGGTVVGTTNSGSGGSFTATYNIPDSLKGKTRIAIRMDSTSGGFFAFNWFWNATT